MSFAQERATAQRHRAAEIAHQLVGDRATHGIRRSILALVQAGEDPKLRSEPQRSGPAAGAREVNSAKRPAKAQEVPF